jgi:hypothetical protein
MNVVPSMFTEKFKKPKKTYLLLQKYNNNDKTSVNNLIIRII